MDVGQVPYQRGFVHGMHFLLLALEGRLSSGKLSAEEVRAAFEEYYLIVEDFRDRFEAPAATKVALSYEDRLA